MEHLPVLKNEVLEQFKYLSEAKKGCFVDATIGLAGHSIAIAQNINCQTSKIKFIGIDKDKSTLKIAKSNIKKNLYENFILFNDDFGNVKQILKNLKIDKIDGALIDLGVSSMQLDDRSRGFSFLETAADLDMRMNKDQDLNAKEIVNHYSEQQLEKILKEYGEESFSKKIAQNICKHRRNKYIEKVGDLLWILEQSIPKKIQKTSKKHFATNTFRALRIEVNNELGDLAETLEKFVDCLNPGGRLAVITFHSTEDRIVKNIFRELSTDCVCPSKAPICTCNHQACVRLVNKKPIIPTLAEIKKNPRSRSAKLRVVEKKYEKV